MFSVVYVRHSVHGDPQVTITHDTVRHPNPPPYPQIRDLGPLGVTSGGDH